MNLKKKKQEQEEQNYFQGENFLQKIKQYKTQSKSIKVKNTQLVHKNIWMKQFEDYHKKQQIIEYISRLSLEYQLEKTTDYIQNKYKIFKDGELTNITNDYNQFTSNVWVQTKNFNTIIKDIKSHKDKNFKPMFTDIKNYISAISQKIDQDYQQALNNLNSIGQPDTTFISNVQCNLDLDRYTQNDFKETEYQFEELLKIQGEEQELVAEYKQSLLLLEMRYSLQNQKLLKDHQNILNRPVSLDKTHANAFNRFKHIYDIYMNKGKERELYSQRIQLEFKDISRQVHTEYDDYFRSLFFYNQKRKAEISMKVKEKDELEQLTEKQIYRNISVRVQEQEKLMEKQSTQQKILSILKDMGERRRTNKAIKMEEEKREKEEEKERLQKEKEKEKDKKAHDQNQKVKSKEYKSFKDAMQRQTVQQLEIERLEQQSRERKIIEKGKEQVTIRQEQRMDKLYQDKQKQQWLNTKQEREEQRITTCIQNYKDRPHVQVSTERLQGQTESTLSRLDTKMDMADKLTLNNNHGYHVEVLMKDMRYKLNHYLVEAGLHNTPYGQQVISQINPSKAPNNLY